VPLVVSPEVAAARAAGRPVVALEPGGMRQDIAPGRAIFQLREDITTSAGETRQDIAPGSRRVAPGAARSGSVWPWPM
jgi:hypothetical protein